MTAKVSVYIATSLDGFIARANGDLDWLTSASDAQSDEDYGYHAFLASVDVVVMGRHTFEQVLTFAAWSYPAHKVVVLSSRTPEIPRHLVDSVERLSLSPQDIVERLSAQGATPHLYIDSGTTIQRFLNADQIDELAITTVPILIEDGISLFGPVHRDITLAHVATRQFPNGFVQSTYRLNRRRQ